MQTIRTLDELDGMLLRLDVAQRISDDELRKLFPTFRMDSNTQVPDDPYSDQYAKIQFDLYHRISGKPYSIENDNLCSTWIRQ